MRLVRAPNGAGGHARRLRPRSLAAGRERPFSSIHGQLRGAPGRRGSPRAFYGGSCEWSRSTTGPALGWPGPRRLWFAVGDRASFSRGARGTVRARPQGATGVQLAGGVRWDALAERLRGGPAPGHLGRCSTGPAAGDLQHGSVGQTGSERWPDDLPPDHPRRPGLRVPILVRRTRGRGIGPGPFRTTPASRSTEY